MKKIYKIADYIIDVKSRRLFHYDKSLSLSSRAFDILLHLVEKRGEVVEKEEIMESVWQGSFVEENNLAVHISALRRVLNEKRGENEFIKTISGRGYSFIASVEEVSTLREKIMDELPRSRNFSKPLADDSFSIAVLPFTLDDTNSDMEYLSIGLTQSLIGDLSQIVDLKVMSYSAVKKYKNAELDLQEIGFLLGVQMILTGHISEFKKKSKVSVELSNTSDKSYVWGNQYDFEFSDIFYVRKSISLAVAQKLKLRFPQDKIKESEHPVENSKAFRLLLKGRYILETISTRNNLKKDLHQALKFFRGALEENPKYVLAYTGIGDVYIHLWNNNLIDKTTARTQASEFLERALTINEKLSEAYVLKGTVSLIFDNNLTEAAQSLNHAIKLNANNPEAYHWLGYIRICFGNFEEAFLLQNKAIQLDPTSIPYNNSLLRVFYFSENYRKAVTQAEEILELDNRSVAAHFFLAIIFAETGRFEEALIYIEKTIKLRPSPDILVAKAYIYALMSDSEKAVEIVLQCLKNSVSESIDLTSVAAVYSALGELDKSFALLEDVYRKGGTELALIKVDPRFKNLRNDQRFAQLLVKLNL